MVTTSSRAILDNEVLSTEMGSGEVVFLHMKTSKYLSLNETGALIWRHMKEGLTLGEIAEKIEAKYDVTLDEAQQHVINLTNELVGEKIVAIAGE